MKVLIDGVEIPFRDSHNTIARDAVNAFITTTSQGPTPIYLATLVAMYQKSYELLNAFGADNIKRAVEMYNEAASKVAGTAEK